MPDPPPTLRKEQPHSKDNPTAVNSNPAKLAGWGNFPVHETLLCAPPAPSLEYSGPEHVLARGEGKSYGDASLNPGGLTISTRQWDRFLSFDADTGLLLCEAGTTLDAIINHFLPRGWFVPVTPGTRLVSVGGAFACNVHGKNHHADKSFAHHVTRLELGLADGTQRWCTPDDDLFWATAGGMGLTGIILRLEMRLIRVETSLIRQRSLVARNLSEMLSLCAEYDSQYKYSVAWIDCLASGESLGRGILMLGEHATREEVSRASLNSPGGQKLSVPIFAPGMLLNKFTITAFNELYFRLQKSKAGDSYLPVGPFFHPLDAIGTWNKLYGRRGFIQYQFVVPEEEAHTVVTDVLNRCRAEGWNSFLSVLKRFGEDSPPVSLSFPFPGVTLTLDVPVRKGLLEFLEALDEVVLAAGGRVYLAKDARLSPESFRQMYPELPAWQEVKRQVDPDWKFSSALSRRLAMEA